jgi:signal transduction histidine kinase
VPCQPDIILQQTVARFGKQVLARGTTIEVACESDIPVCIWDEQRIASALANLISNALEHSGGDTIRVSAFRAGPAVAFEIADSGSGIAPDDVPRVFDRFYRGRGRRVDGHAGLGLALVREIVERHGGTVGLQSEVGTGTRVTLTLPIEAPNLGHVEASSERDMTA